MLGTTPLSLDFGNGFLFPGRLLTGDHFGGIPTDMHHDLLTDMFLDQRFMHNIAQASLGKLGEGT